MQIVDSNIGRCLQKRPGKEIISYTLEEITTDKNILHRLKNFDFSSKKVNEFMLLPKNSQYYVWLSIDNVISSDGNSLVMTYINTKSEWKILKNSSKFNLSGISRLALSPDRSKIAVVTIMP